jgi:hypothetical protein
VGRKSCFVISAVLLLLGIPCANGQVDAALRIENSLVVARGRWSPIHHKPADQKPSEEPKPTEQPPRLQVDSSHLPLVEIHCFKVVNFCMQAAATVQGNEPQLAVEYYEIRHWDKQAIVAENKGFNCRTQQLKISFVDGNVTATVLPKKSEKGAGEACEAQAQTISYELIGEGHEEASERSPAQ